VGRAGVARDAQLRLLVPVVIGALVGLGRLDEARGAARRLLEAFPTYNLTLQRQINPWRDQAFGERYLDALRTAGIPD
jgi:adenylate cyclase